MLATWRLDRDLSQQFSVPGGPFSDNTPLIQQFVVPGSQFLESAARKLILIFISYENTFDGDGGCDDGVWAVCP
jgi:hypothetical protein